MEGVSCAECDAPGSEVPVPQKSMSRKLCCGRMSVFYACVPMCLAEFLSFTVPRAVIPGMQAAAFGHNSYAVECATFAVQGVLSFFFCPIFGTVSDSIGRRIPLAVAAAGAVVPMAALVMGYSMAVFQVLSALSGMAKGTLVVVFAYVADCIPPGAERTNAFGVVTGLFGLALSIGPYLGSYVSAHRGDMAVFELTLVLGLVAVVYSLCVLPETREKDNVSTASGLKSAASNPLLVVQNVVRDPYMKRLLTIALLYYISYWGLVSSVMLYLTRELNFTVVERGRFLSLVGMYHMIAEFFIVRVCLRAGFKDKTLLQVGLVGWTVKLVLLSVAQSRWMLDVVCMMSLMSALFNPALISLASTAAEMRGTQVCLRPLHTQPHLTNLQGEVQGAVAAFRALAEGVGPFMMGILFTVCGRGSRFPGMSHWEHTKRRGGDDGCPLSLARFHQSLLKTYLSVDNTVNAP